MDAQRFPLDWPLGWKRTPYSQRQAAKFSRRQVVNGPPGSTSTWHQQKKLDVGDGLARLTDELRRLGASHVVISSNLRVRGDGLPYAAQAKQLDDPGVAVYFRLRSAARVLACDRWRSAADNMAAIAGHIEAIRAVDRYGVGTLEQAFAGYKALPADTAADWRMVLFGVKEWRGGVEDVQAAYRARAREVHPDVTHDDGAAMAHLNRAREYALAELSA